MNNQQIFTFLILMVIIGSLNISVFGQNEAFILGIDASPANDLMVLSNSREEVVVQRLSSDNIISVYPQYDSIKHLSSFDMSIGDIDLSPDASMIAVTFSGYDANIIRIIRTTDGTLVKELFIHSTLGQIDWSSTPNGERIAITSSTGGGSTYFSYIVLVDASDFTVLSEREVDEYSGIEIEFNPAGTQIAYIQDSDVIISDLDGNDIFQLVEHKQIVSDLAWSPSGNHIATIEDSSLKVWDAQSGSRISDFPIHIADTFSFPTEIVWNPSGNQIAILGNSAIYIWDMSTNTIINQIDTNYSVLDALWLSEDEIYFTAGDSVVVRILNTCDTALIVCDDEQLQTRQS